MKKEVLDPQGKVVSQTLKNMGYNNIVNVRQGKYFEIELDETDKEKAKRVARKLRSGMVEINGESFANGAPFGGYKQSGSGREGGTWGLEEYLEIKSISGWK